MPEEKVKTQKGLKENIIIKDGDLFIIKNTYAIKRMTLIFK